MRSTRRGASGTSASCGGGDDLIDQLGRVGEHGAGFGETPLLNHRKKGPVTGLLPTPTFVLFWELRSDHHRQRALGHLPARRVARYDEGDREPFKARLASRRVCALARST